MKTYNIKQKIVREDACARQRTCQRFEVSKKCARSDQFGQNGRQKGDSQCSRDMKHLAKTRSEIIKVVWTCG